MKPITMFAALAAMSVASALGAQESPPAAPVVPDYMSAMVGSYDVVLTIPPTECPDTEGFSGEWRSAMDVAQSYRGIQLRLEQTKSFFREPVLVQPENGGFAYRGPVRVYFQKVYPTIHLELVGSPEADGQAIMVMLKGFNRGCSFTGELKGSRNSSPLRVPSVEPADRRDRADSAPPPAAQPVPAPDPTAGRTLGKRKRPGSIDSTFNALMNSESSFQTYNFPDRYIRHAHWLGIVEPPMGNYGSIIFRMVPGLGGRCASLESKDQPGHFLRHQDWRIKLSRLDSDGNMRADATFCLVPGLASTTGISFEAISARGHFIRHRNFELWLDRPDGSDQFKKDSTFLAAPPGGAAPGVR